MSNVHRSMAERLWRSVMGSEEEEEEEGGLKKRQEITGVRGKGARCFMHVLK